MRKRKTEEEKREYSRLKAQAYREKMSKDPEWVKKKKEYNSKYFKTYYQIPENKEKIKSRARSPEAAIVSKAYKERNAKEISAKQKIKRSTPEFKEKSSRRQKTLYEKIESRNNSIRLAFERGYTINNEGKVFSPQGKEKKMTPRKEGDYLQVSVAPVKGYKGARIYVHRMQAYKKFGEKIFEKGMTTRHLNNNPRDNSWENIGIGTLKENMQDIPKERRVKKCALLGKRKRQKDLPKKIKRKILTRLNLGFLSRHEKNPHLLPRFISPVLRGIYLRHCQ